MATLLIAALVCSLGSAYFRTQIIQNADYTLRSDDNRLRVITIPAPRGAVYDRNGALIAETVTTYMLFLDTPSADSTHAGLQALQGPLKLSDSTVVALDALRKKQPAEPLLLSSELTFEQVSWVEEHRSELPRLTIEARPQRHYSQGEAVAHLIGYTAEISEKELADSSKWVGYKAGQIVGKSGIEKQYEPLLGGHPGERYVEVDARGKVIGMLAPEQAKKPVAGKDIHLTIDLDLQRFAHEIFPKEMNGAIVAMVPSTGEILALYSNPTFDPNELIQGISPELWKSLNTDPRRPLLNRATAGTYPPASTFKLATALIGLEQGVITPETRMPIPCTGGMSYAGRYSRCWKKEGHGSQDLAGAIQNSCNVYFYQLGIWLGLGRMTAEGTRLGFSRKTGLDLPTEINGTFPAGTAWYKKKFGWTPTPSEVMSLAIGQGPNAQTPLRMVQFFSALAGDGTAQTPHLLANAPSAHSRETDLHVSREALQAVRVGMGRVTEQGGTAYMASLKNWKLYGKTGTGQNSQDADHDHAWFGGFAGPRDGEPEIAVAAIIEFGEHGSVAAQLAAKVADFYLNKKHGLKTDPHSQTLAERMSAKAE